MGFLDGVRDFFTLTPPPIEERSGDSLEDFIVRYQGLRTRPWRASSTSEAMGVPAVFRAVNLIANITGSLTLKAFRAGVQLSDTERPRLIVRPDPFTIPREFFRRTAYGMARYGEAWWWIAARDIDGQPLSLIPVPAREIQVTENPRDLRYPLIDWRNRRMRNEDMVQIFFSREEGSLRGTGPLQACGAAVSVAVEAQEWAANFFAEGGRPSLWIKSAVGLSPEDAAALKTQWVEGESNVPKVTDPTIEDIKDVGINTESSQMFEARAYQNSEVARMFGIPGTLLDAAISGQSITYQNVEGEFAKFVRACLLPDYLEPIEQSMSDLLTRSTVARFNLDALLRADIKTRFEVYEIGTRTGVYTPEEARAFEGLDAGDIENAPMPLAVPQAVPSSLPVQGRSIQMRSVRCHKCDKSMGDYSPPWDFICPRCKTHNVMGTSEPTPITQLRILRDAEGRVTGAEQKTVG